MSQSKLNDLAGKFKAGGPPGLGIGLKLLAGVGIAAYAATQSVYTGKCAIFHNSRSIFRQLLNITFQPTFNEGKVLSETKIHNLRLKENKSSIL